MIKMIYDPIMGARYISVDVDPRTETQMTILAKMQEQYNRERRARAKQLRRNNTKQK